MVDTQKLKLKIANSGLKTGFIAGEVGVSRQCLLNKVNNLSDFKSKEILSLQRVLALSPDERDEIFFNESVDIMSTTQPNE